MCVFAYCLISFLLMFSLIFFSLPSLISPFPPSLPYLPPSLPSLHLRFVPSTFSWYAAFLVKAFPLDMSQYSRLFSSTRIPCQDKDELTSYEGSRHIVVMRHGNFYEVEALQRNGEGVGQEVVGVAGGGGRGGSHEPIIYLHPPSPPPPLLHHLPSSITSPPPSPPLPSSITSLSSITSPSPSPPLLHHFPLLSIISPSSITSPPPSLPPPLHYLPLLHHLPSSPSPPLPSITSPSSINHYCGHIGSDGCGQLL